MPPPARGENFADGVGGWVGGWVRCGAVRCATRFVVAGVHGDYTGRRCFASADGGGVGMALVIVTCRLFLGANAERDAWCVSVKPRRTSAGEVKEDKRHEENINTVVRKRAGLLFGGTCEARPPPL